MLLLYTFVFVLLRPHNSRLYIPCVYIIMLYDIIWRPLASHIYIYILWLINIDYVIVYDKYINSVIYEDVAKDSISQLTRPWSHPAHWVAIFSRPKVTELGRWHTCRASWIRQHNFASFSDSLLSYGWGSKCEAPIHDSYTSRRDIIHTVPYPYPKSIPLIHNQKWQVVLIPGHFSIPSQ